MRRRHVFIVSESYPPSLTQLLQGIVDYAGPRDRWEIHKLMDALPESRLPEKMDGVLLGLRGNSLDNMLSRRKIPVVSVFEPPFVAHWPAVVPDDFFIGQLAADHLLGKGIKHFGFWGPCCPFGDLREAGFRKGLEKKGLTCTAYKDLFSKARDATWTSIGRKDLVKRWLRQLPTPAGVFAVNDDVGVFLLHICREIKLRVPDDISIMSVDNEPTICEPTPIPLTSIDPDLHKIGFIAAELLDRMMSGQPAPSSPVRISPKGIVQRRSTDALAVEDPDVRGALAFIREHACENITVRNVLAAVPIGRRSSEKRFTQAMGVTPGQEIRRVKLQRASEMLRNTDMKLDLITAYCGFQNRSHFSAAFQKAFGVSASEYRKNIHSPMENQAAPFKLREPTGGSHIN